MGGGGTAERLCLGGQDYSTPSLAFSHSGANCNEVWRYRQLLFNKA